ncbi:MAG: ABC transporter ATP-binding protein [Myxococcota bacterium]|nr:ABC transporter ATP-binding protein [Myxococcota bacterium]
MALERASLELGEGELVAVVGENGAGKTSLMNVLYGLYQPDGGEIRIGGERVRLKSPKEALARGIGMVHQHFMLVPNLTVAENVVLGHEPRRFGLLDFQRACAQVEETCSRFGFRLDPRALVQDLSVGSQQKVEIVKALHRGARILILDEPTAVLTPQESDELFGVARQLARAGHTVVFISHKLREVLSVAERIIVMRRGRTVAEVKAAGTSPEQLAELMVGGKLPEAIASREPVSAAAPPVLELREVTAGGAHGKVALAGVSLTVRQGEIVGIAGVDGNGQSELAEVLTGLRSASGGQLLLDGQPLTGSPGDRRGRGLTHIPEDRLRRAIISPMTVEENMALGRQHTSPFANGPWIDQAGRRERTARLLADFDVRPPDPLARMGSLSGGNQQKVVVARELDPLPKVIVVVQPTRGLDIGAVAQVHRRLIAERARGAAVLLISLDLDEVLALADRVYVLFGGRIAGEVGRAQFDERRIGRMMLGAPEAPPEIAAHG